MSDAPVSIRLSDGTFFVEMTDSVKSIPTELISQVSILLYGRIMLKDKKYQTEVQP